LNVNISSVNGSYAVFVKGKRNKLVVSASSLCCCLHASSPELWDSFNLRFNFGVYINYCTNFYFGSYSPI